MNPNGFHPATYSAVSREQWSDAADAFAEELAPRLEPYGLRLLQLLDVEALPRGARVLDLASGPGEPALTLATRLARRAHVWGSDFSPKMVAIARTRAKALNLANLEFREIDAAAIPFESASFDLVTCRFGLMLMAEPGRVAVEVARVLKQGAFFGLTVWAESGRTGPLGTIRTVLKTMVPPGLLPPAPDTYELGNEGRLRVLLEEAGMAVRIIESFSHPWHFSSTDDYWTSLTAGSPTGAAVLALPEDLRRAVEVEVRRRLRGSAQPDETLAIEAEALIVVARKEPSLGSASEQPPTSHEPPHTDAPGVGLTEPGGAA